MTYFLLISGVSLAILALLVWRAPRGWQDEDGFHLGEEPYRSVDTVDAKEATIRIESAAPVNAKARVRKAA